MHIEDIVNQLLMCNSLLGVIVEGPTFAKKILTLLIVHCLLPVTI